MTDMQRPKIGAHVSAAGGLWQAVERARTIGAECLQIFGASPRGWAAKLPAKAEADRFKAALKEAKLGPVYLHAAYLVNLASPESVNRAKSVKSLIAHLRIAEALGATGLIFHLGSGKGMPRAEAVDLTLKGMRAVLKAVPPARRSLGEGGGKYPLLIMENSAGGGDKLGTRPEEIGELFERMKSKRVAVCIDTAHAFEAGAIERYTQATVKIFVSALDRTIGLEHILAIHANDSKTPASSHRDQHENIGDGHIGRAGFRALAAERRLHHCDWILEVPGIQEEGPDAENIKRLRSCFLK